MPHGYFFIFYKCNYQARIERRTQVVCLFFFAKLRKEKEEMEEITMKELVERLNQDEKKIYIVNLFTSEKNSDEKGER